MLADADLDALAGALAGAQTEHVAAAVRRVCGRHPEISVAVVTGVGDFIAREAARRAGLSPVRLAERLGHEPARAATAIAVATLLGQALASSRS
jgi:uncharacterized hydantoinase/oxoprolinase family protein